jgi:hypothetical protein
LAFAARTLAGIDIMLSNPQKAILKRAQREAGLTDDDYRDALETVTSFRTSTAPALTDRHFDKLLGYLEAIHWQAVDAGKLQPSGSPVAVFRQRGYWARKNTKLETSRDRFNQSNLGHTITDLEHGLGELGFGQAYCEGIRQKTTQGRTDAHAQHLYRAALIRTLRAKRNLPALAIP